MLKSALVILGLLFVLLPYARGQQFDPTAPGAIEIVRESHLNSYTLPDGIALIEQARILSITSKDDLEGTAQLLAEESGLSQAQATKAITMSVEALVMINEDVRNRHYELACTFGGLPKVYGSDVYAVFEQMDDVRETVSENHLSSLLERLGENDGILFRQWLHGKKINTQYVKFDFKKAYEKSGESADGVLAGICANLSENSQ